MRCEDDTTHPPLFTPTRFSFSIAISTSWPFEMPSSLLLTVRNASVDATTIAALSSLVSTKHENWADDDT